MGFLSPSVPKPPPLPNTAIVADASQSGISGGATNNLAALMSANMAGLKRKASTQRTSLIGGG